MELQPLSCDAGVPWDDGNKVLRFKQKQKMTETLLGAELHQGGRVLRADRGDRVRRGRVPNPLHVGPDGEVPQQDEEDRDMDGEGWGHIQNGQTRFSFMLLVWSNYVASISLIHNAHEPQKVHNWSLAFHCLDQLVL